MMYEKSDNASKLALGVAIAALFIGGAIGPLQKLEHVGINWYGGLSKISTITNYYQGLSIHGTLNALVWTTFFIVGFFSYAYPRSIGRELRDVRISHAGNIIMILGLLMAAYPLLAGLANVMFTFYPPLKAHPFFYIGLTLVVVGSWLHGVSYYVTHMVWRKENPKKRMPLIAFMVLVTMVMWQFATIGIAVEMLWLVIPWSLGLVDGIDPQLARTFFWFTGHPIVYFWLLPAYLSWYAMIPKQAGGKLFSDNLARLVFWLFLVLSIPVGLHHQYVDPGVAKGWKLIHATLTYSLFIPSVMTAFTLGASLEIAGRARGGKGLFGWIRKLPWDDPSYTIQNLAMILFVFGGIGGVTNASYNVNLVIHNTMWIPGHFHLTVASAATMSYFGILYWLIPALSGKPLFSRKLALWQAWTWFGGMILMSNGLHVLGLNFGPSRRTMLGMSQYASPDWQPLLIEAAIGGVTLGISGLMFYTNVLGTIFSKKRLEKPIEMPIAEPVNDNPGPLWLDNWKPWIALTAFLIILAYGPVLVDLISNINMSSPMISP